MSDLPPVFGPTGGKNVLAFSYHVLVPAPMTNRRHSGIPECPLYRIAESAIVDKSPSYCVPACGNAGLPGLRIRAALSLDCGGNAAVVSDVNASLKVIEMDGTARKSLPHQQARG
jgi:hypothetical protein